jgi:carbamoyltransferase
MNILGIHSGHDASLSLIKDGRLVSSIAIERHSRFKKDQILRPDVLDTFLTQNKIGLNDIDFIAMGYWHKENTPWMEIYSPLDLQYPFSTFGTYNKERALLNHLEVETKVEVTEYGYTLPEYIDRIHPPYTNTVVTGKYNLPLNCVITGYDRVIPGYFIDHHMAHAASVYYTSPFDEAVIMTADGSMNDPENSSGYFIGQGNLLSSFREPGLMIGNFYDAATEHLGLGPGATKAGTLMGLAAYGRVSGKVKKMADEWLKPIWQRNSPVQDNQYIDWLFAQITGKWPHPITTRQEIIDGDPDSHFYQRKVQSVFKKGDYNKQEVMNYAADVQYLCERAMVKYAQQLYEESEGFNSKNLCLAGGVALNCNANFKVRTETDFENIHFFPACGDDGISAGAALYVNHMMYNHPRENYTSDQIAYLGGEYNYQPEAKGKYISKDLDIKEVAQLISEGKIVCWFQGRSEFGPRALGNRSFITDPRRKEMKDILNSRVKFREWFRPFAPVVLNEHKEEWFDMNFESPHMLYTVPCKKPQEIPSVAHIDNTARVQTLTREHNPIFYSLIEEFNNITGVPIVMNTSLNVKGEPIVETPEDAMKLFEESDVDILVINDRVYFK